MIKACIFDMDGTLLDTEVLWVEATSNFLRDHEIPLSGEELSRIVYGKSWHDVYDELRRRLDGLETPREAMAADLSLRMRALRQSHDIRIPGSVELLKRLSAKVAVCIVSGSPREDVVEGIRAMQAEPHLAFFLGAEDYAPGKPDPACFNLAARRLGVSGPECVVFEDSTAGVAAARAANMFCVGLARPGAPAQDLSQADRVVSSLERFELPC